MKKLLLLLLIAPVLGFGQVLTDVKYLSGWNIYPDLSDGTKSNFHPRSYDTPDGIISTGDAYEERVVKYIIPQGKFWKIVSAYTANNASSDLNNDGVYSNLGNFNSQDNIELFIYSNDMGFFPIDLNYNKTENLSTAYNILSYKVSDGAYLKGGIEFAIGLRPYQIIIYEYTLNDSSLSYNKPEAIYNNFNTPILYPNPTSSLLALNSEKEYNIEVYDMAGNKVMALTGNNINMAHLSTATYIVKATDKSNNEELTYKVVKN